MTPTGALLKYGLSNALTAASFSACGEDGRLLAALNAPICPCVLVRNFTRSAASFGCLLCVGTASQEPPQLPPPPGTPATSHLPLCPSPPNCLMRPSIQAGHGAVAKAFFFSAWLHGSDRNCTPFARPACDIFTVSSQAAFTAGFDSMTNLLLWSK